MHPGEIGTIYPERHKDDHWNTVVVKNSKELKYLPKSEWIKSVTLSQEEYHTVVKKNEPGLQYQHRYIFKTQRFL